MATLIFLIIVAFAPPEAWLMAMVAFGVVIYVLGFFYAPKTVWGIATLLVAMRVTLEFLMSAPGSDLPLPSFVPMLASVVECVVFVVLAGLTAFGLVTRRIVGESAYHHCVGFFQSRSKRKEDYSE